MKHLSLGITIAAAVLIGSLGARVLYTEWLAYQAAEALKAVSRQLDADAERQAARTRAARAQSRAGKDLRRRCEEFKAAYQANGGSYALEQTGIACKRYETYIDTGRR